jgi:hypothetical protein
MKSAPFHVSLVLCLLCCLTAVPLYAQQEVSTVQQTVPAAPPRASSHPAQEFRGFNMYESFQGAIGSSGSIFKLDSTAGYDFNRYVGVFAGIPLYFAHDSSSADNLTGSGGGDVYFGLELYAPTRVVSYGSTFTVSAPTGNVTKGFSTGHRTFDWTNRVYRRFGHFMPFVSAGVSNTVPDTDLVTRTFTSLGNVVHLEEGAEYDLTKRVYAGASGYHIFPFGNQQVFNRVDDSGGGPGDSRRDKDAPNPAPPPSTTPPPLPVPPSSSGAGLTRENGFDTWVGFEPARVLRLEIGYSRSVTFDFNRLSIYLGMNVGRLLHKQGGRQD